MTLFRKSKAPVFKDFAEKIEYLGIDLKELLARKVVDTTINEIVFKLKNQNSSTMWKQFVEELREYNDLEKIHKTDTKYKSKYGKSIVGFDIWENHPIIWFADNIGGEAMRINGQKQWAISCYRTYSTINTGTPILRNRLIITSKNTSYMFISGFGVDIKNQKQVDKINSGKIDTQTIADGWIPLDWCSLKIPNYIREQFRVGAFNHNYGVLPAMEMLNKDFVDSDGVDTITLDGTNKDIFYADWYPANDIIEYFNGFLQFISSEMLYDQTRIIGTFSQQDINKLAGIDNTKEEKANSIINKLTSRLNVKNNETNFIMKKLILRSIGGEGSQLDKMQTTYKALEYSENMDKILSLFFKMSGYSWDGDSVKVYENVSQTLNSSKGVYESTKEKIVLFERQWKEFYTKLAFAWFKNNGSPFANLDEAKKSFEENIEFQIVSNVLQQENNDYQKVLELKQNGLISTKKAIKDLNPDMSNEEVEEELQRIKEENNFNNYYDDNFNNQDFIGYEENENPAVDNYGKDFKVRE